MTEIIYEEILLILFISMINVEWILFSHVFYFENHPLKVFEASS